MRRVRITEVPPGEGSPQEEFYRRLMGSPLALVQRMTIEEDGMDQAELEFWRKAVRGEAGYNGQPQALLALLRVSDASQLRRLSAAYPEAVSAFLEEHEGG